MNLTDRQLDRVFHALADTTRRQILEQIQTGELTVSEIAEAHHMSFPAITKHLGVLEEAGLLKRKKMGRKRLCRVERARLTEALNWLKVYQDYWGDQLDNLKTFIETHQHVETKSDE